MCGLYAVLNFLQMQEDWAEEKPAKSLWYLLDACRHFGWLTPQNLTEGFEDHQLKAILDLQIHNYRLKWSTHFLEDVAAYNQIDSFSELTRRVIARGGALIGQHARREHWLLIYDSNGVIVTWDSAGGAEPEKKLSNRQRSIGIGWGLVILPNDRSVPKVVI